jgi:hypothetical protein
VLPRLALISMHALAWPWQAGLEVNGVMGTSAGALTGSLYCAGYTPRQVRALRGVDANVGSPLFHTHKLAVFHTHKLAVFPPHTLMPRSLRNSQGAPQSSISASRPGPGMAGSSPLMGWLIIFGPYCLPHSRSWTGSLR